jgi:phage gpG-like protein
MAGTKVQVELYGTKLISRKLLRVADAVDDARPAWPAVTRRVAEAFERNFAQEGPGWPQLAPSTVRQRVREGHPGAHPILTRTGQYRRALTGEIRANERPEDLQIMAPVVPGHFHQHGTSRMPARPMRFNEAERQDVVKIIQRHLLEGWRS